MEPGNITSTWVDRVLRSTDGATADGICFLYRILDEQWALWRSEVSLKQALLKLDPVMRKLHMRPSIGYGGGLTLIDAAMTLGAKDDTFRSRDLFKRWVLRFGEEERGALFDFFEERCGRRCDNRLQATAISTCISSKESACRSQRTKQNVISCHRRRAALSNRSTG